MIDTLLTVKLPPDQRNKGPGRVTSQINNTRYEIQGGSREVHFLGHVVNSNESEVEWGVKQEEAFQTLKEILCNAPILLLLDGAEDSVVYYDASNQGLWCVLMQRGKVIAYASWQLQIHEKNYTIHDLELGAIVFALKSWRHYLYGTKSVNYTNHKSLQHIFDQKELNMRQRRWIKLFSDYHCEICYHPGKANSSIKEKLLAAQNEATKEENAPAEMLHGLDKQIEKKGYGGLYIMDRIWVPLIGDVRTMIRDEAHAMRYFIHPRVDKMYYDLRDMYWCLGMKKDIATYLEIPEWKWDKITMDFITKMPRSSGGHDTIWVTVDRLTKSAPSLAIREDYSMERSSRLYINEIVAWHRVPMSIISDRDGQFTSRLWKALQKALGTRLDTTCMIDFGGNWDTHLPLAELSYNNSYHSSILCAPFEVLYGKKCRSPVLWAEVRENRLISPEMVQETTDKVVLIK
ncbi:putative reverse transcriptase domain-containing protein [Tanacetum coccineum]